MFGDEREDFSLEIMDHEGMIDFVGRGKILENVIRGRNVQRWLRRWILPEILVWWRRRRRHAEANPHGGGAEGRRPVGGGREGGVLFKRGCVIFSK